MRTLVIATNSHLFIITSGTPDQLTVRAWVMLIQGEQMDAVTRNLLEKLGARCR